jgi:hypothetical protein
VLAKRLWRIEESGYVKVEFCGERSSNAAAFGDKEMVLAPLPLSLPSAMR